MFLLQAFTTADLRDVSYPRALAALIERAFGLDEVWARWLPDGSDTPTKVPLRSLSEDDLAARHGRSRIALGDRTFRLVSADISWNRISPGDRRNFLRGQGYRQNEICVRTERERLDEPAFHTMWLELCRDVADLFHVNYLIARDPAVTRATFRTQLGLGAGLPGIYWINVFGGPFVECIGAEKLLLATDRTERLAHNRILVRLDDAMLDPARAASVAGAARAAIGEACFVKPELPRQESPKAVISLLRAPLLFWKISREFFDESRNAAIRPQFDFSEILLDE